MPITTIADEIHQTRPFSSAQQEAVINLMRTEAVLTHYLDNELKTAGLTQQQYNVLRILRGAGEPLPIMAIGERLVQPTPGITRLLGRMARDGLVERQPNPEDARSVLIGLSDAGSTRLQQADGVVETANARMAGDLDDQELKQLCGLLDRIRAGVRGD